MNISQLLVLIALVSSLLAAFFYYSTGKLRRNRIDESALKMRQRFADRLYTIMASAVILTSALLFYFLFTHQFQYEYVAHYSSLEQPFIYLVSAFWAGQEGTFLLWALLVSVMGFVFRRRLPQTDGYAMVTVSAFIGFLSVLLMVKSPFAELAQVPANGQGMNPLLMDPWMAVHPPILFVGYAATIFPYALVLSALARRNFENWTSKGFAWTLFASVMLGAGIIIGGFWAYEVLGWGGYWGWDPVENSSLVPWLVLLALIHGLIIEKSKGSMRRTNMFLGLLTFILVLYATFLTRSGVLADFSVHSFVDLGINNYLIGIMLVSTVLGFGLFVTRFKGITSPKVDTSSLNREVALVLSMIVLGLIALFTFAGMSSPILTGFVGKASQVDISFYNKVNLPVAIAMALLLGITPFLGWTEDKRSGLLKRLSMSVLLTALSLAIAYVAGVNTPMLMLFVAASAFGLISNVIVVFRQYRSGWISLGGPLSHIGVGLVLIGIIGSGNYDSSTKMVLKPNVPQSAYGYTFTFRGMQGQPPAKTSVLIEVNDGKTTFQTSPKLYWSEYNQSVMREPEIKVLPLTDLYISPLEMQENAQAHQHEHPTLELGKGELKDLAGYKVEFVRFETGQHGQGGGMSVGAVLAVTAHGEKHEIMPQVLINERGERELVPASFPSFTSPNKGVEPPQVTLASMSVEQKKVLLAVHGMEGDAHNHDESEMYDLIVDISMKPLMMVIWTGVILIIGGSAMAFAHRLKVA